MYMDGGIKKYRINYVIIPNCKKYIDKYKKLVYYKNTKKN